MSKQSTTGYHDDDHIMWGVRGACSSLSCSHIPLILRMLESELFKKSIEKTSVDVFLSGVLEA